MPERKGSVRDIYGPLMYRWSRSNQPAEIAQDLQKIDPKEQRRIWERDQALFGEMQAIARMNNLGHLIRTPKIRIRNQP